MKKLILISLAILALFLLSTNGYAQKRTVKTKIKLVGTTFNMKNVAAGKYIDIPGHGNVKNGANIQLWDLDDGNDRKVKFISAGNGYYHIQFQHTKAEFDVNGCYKDRYFCKTYKEKKGANVQMWAAGSAKVHQWKLEQINPGQFKITNRYSHKVLDASASHIHENGCNVLQWDWKGTKNQLWELYDVKTGTRYQIVKKSKTK